jgi:hypothetical protein
MRINKITFTGADDNTNIDDLIQIQEKYPFLEFGILISSKSGNRYPSENWIENLKDKNLNLALHVCGKHVRNILCDGVLYLPYDWFHRYQLNINFSATKTDITHSIDLLKKYENKKFIIQYNSANKIYINDLFKNKNDNVEILYDASGGRGSQIKTIEEPPYNGVYTGYAGGINVDNIETICKEIYNHKNNSLVWIDMESGVRTNDEFDLEKINIIAEKVIKYM